MSKKQQIIFFVLFLFLWMPLQASSVLLKKQDSTWLFDVVEFSRTKNLQLDLKAIEKHVSITGKNFKSSFVIGLSYFSFQGNIIPLQTRTEMDAENHIFVPVEVLPEIESFFKEKYTLDTLKNVLTLNKEIKPEKSKNKKRIKDDRKAKAGEREVKTIIIDPGHGGKDPGALGAKSQEKDIVLAVSRELKKELEKEGFEVHLTRSEDVFVELSERPNIANKANGDLFISIHCNAIDGKEKQKKTEGYHFYVLRSPESEEDKAIARRENKVATLYGDKKSKAEISPVEWIKIEASLALYQQNSFRFTEQLVHAFKKGKLKQLGGGAGGAGFMVLVGALMPAVLVELGFITHPEDEAYMMSEKGQKALAFQIAKAVQNYRDVVHSYIETLSH